MVLLQTFQPIRHQNTIKFSNLIYILTFRYYKPNNEALVHLHPHLLSYPFQLHCISNRYSGCSTQCLSQFVLYFKKFKIHSSTMVQNTYILAHPKHPLLVEAPPKLHSPYHSKNGTPLVSIEDIKTQEIKHKIYYLHNKEPFLDIIIFESQNKIIQSTSNYKMKNSCIKTLINFPFP